MKDKQKQKSSGLLGYIILLAIPIVCLFAIDFVFSLFMDFPGPIGVIEWIIENPDIIPGALVLSVGIIILIYLISEME